MNSNYKTLMNYNAELNQYKQKSVLYHMLQSKIVEFYKLNGVRIQSILDKSNALSEKYFIFDENKQPIFDGEGDDRKQRTNIDESTGDPYTWEQYESEFDQLMNTPCEIHFSVKTSFIGNNGKNLTIVN